MKATAFPQCKIHGYEFRIVCEECQDKYLIIQNMIRKQFIKAQKENEKHNK